MLQNLQKKYKGQIGTERLAARVYDKRAITTHGLKAKTNFSYTKGQLLRILKDQDDLDAEDLNQVELDETLEI